MKTFIKPFRLFMILALVLSCGNTNNNKKNITSRNLDNMQKFKKLAYIDTQGTGLEAFSFLMPSDWKFEGGITWNPEQVAMPASNAFRINQKWQAKYNNVIEYLAQQQIQHIRSVGEFSRTLSQMSDQMRSDQLQQYEQRSSVYDKVAQQHSDNMLGIERYYDPFEEREVQLPSGYNNAWCNNLGEYIMTDNPNYNPNLESNLTWKPIEHK